MKYFFTYLIIINIIGLFIMWLDKYKAKHHLWRIPEKMLFGVSLIGGSIGTLTGMYMFRHKTKHWYFILFMPLILILHITIFVLYFYYF